MRRRRDLHRTGVQRAPDGEPDRDDARRDDPDVEGRHRRRRQRLRCARRHAQGLALFPRGGATRSFGLGRSCLVLFRSFRALPETHNSLDALLPFPFQLRRWHRRRLVFTYILRCADGTLYVGHTHDLASREKSHNDGCGSGYTSTRRPAHMVYAEENSSLKRAMARERQVKRWTTEKKEALISADAAKMRLVAEPEAKGADFSWRDLPNRLKPDGES